MGMAGILGAPPTCLIRTPPLFFPMFAVSLRSWRMAVLVLKSRRLWSLRHSLLQSNQFVRLVPLRTVRRSCAAESCRSSDRPLPHIQHSTKSTQTNASKSHFKLFSHASRPFLLITIRLKTLLVRVQVVDTYAPDRLFPQRSTRRFSSFQCWMRFTLYCTARYNAMSNTGGRRPMHHSDSLAEAFRERMVPISLVDSNTAFSVLATPYALPTRLPAAPTSRSSRRTARGHNNKYVTSPSETSTTPTSSSHVLREIELPENTSLDESYSSCMAIAPTCTSSNCDNDQAFSARRIRLGGSPIPIDNRHQLKTGGAASAFRDKASSPKSGHAGRFHSATTPHQAFGLEHKNLASTPRHRSSSPAVATPLSTVHEAELHWTHSPLRTTSTIAASTTARSNFTMGVSFPSAWKRRLRYSRT
jgi:hypothetical protein